MEKISFVIPCYHSAQTIEGVINEIEKTVKGVDGYDYEVILVNDSSPDNTFEVISSICTQNMKVKGIDLSRNFGQHSALMAGFHYVDGEIVVCLDDDGQTPADEVFKLIQELDNNADVVYARYPEKKHSIFRNFGSKVNEIMARFLIGKPKELYISSYFVARRFVIDEIIKYNNPYPYVIGLVLRTTDKIVNVDVKHREREIGASGYTFNKLIKLWLNGFTAFSVKPLRIATLVGAVFSFVGFMYALFVIINKVLNPEIVVGWTSMISSVMIIGGLNLFMVGLVGEYIGRIYISINNAPQFVIKKEINLYGEIKEIKEEGKRHA